MYQSFRRPVYDTYYGDSHEDPGCIGAVVKIGSRAETQHAPIGISPTYMDDPCGTADSQ